MIDTVLFAIPSGMELIIVLAVILLLFGSTKLPKLARSLGASVTEFKKGVKGGDEDEKKISGGDEKDEKVEWTEGEKSEEKTD
ncbi:MAG: Sec-independent protein translocase subunit TatA/TatB [Planctomycetota bacterium]